MLAASAAAQTRAFVLIYFSFFLTLCSMCLPCVRSLLQRSRGLSTDYLTFFEHISAPPVGRLLACVGQDRSTRGGPETEPSTAICVPDFNGKEERGKGKGLNGLNGAARGGERRNNQQPTSNIQQPTVPIRFVDRTTLRKPGMAGIEEEKPSWPPFFLVSLEIVSQKWTV